MGQVTYRLKKPVTLGQAVPVSELVFRDEVVCDDLRGLQVNALARPTVDDLIKISSRLCAQSELLMGKLSTVDFAEVAALVWGFLNAGPETGTSA